MEKLTEVLASRFSMDGYGLYIWPSYLIAALVLGAMIWISLRALKRAHTALERLQQGASSYEA